jgi:hypothetical protein
MRFSGKHENDGWYSLEIARVQHYELLFDVKDTFLSRLLTHIKSTKGTRHDM